MEETAAILIIGDEVVSGLVQEGCSYSLMAALRQQGISTKQVRQKFDSAILPALSLP
jgi:molybdopterin-biosynthesis enzyme MoeA-like protein